MRPCSRKEQGLSPVQSPRLAADPVRHDQAQEDVGLFDAVQGPGGGAAQGRRTLWGVLSADNTPQALLAA